MHRRLVHLCIVAATTLATGRHVLIPVHPKQPSNVTRTTSNGTTSPPNGTCRFSAPVASQSHCGNLSDVCARPDEHVTKSDLVIPVLIWLCVFAVAYMPTLLLSSSSKLHQLKAGIVQLIFVFLLVISGYLLFPFHRSGAYCITLHATVFLLLHPARAILMIGNSAYHMLRLLGVVLVLAFAWHLGPPVPVVFSPEISFCCGAMWHLVGLGLVDVICSVLVFVLYSVFI